MSKVIALDVGTVRTGIAESDPMQMMAFPLETVATTDLLSYLETYVAREGCHTLVIGQPQRLHGEVAPVEAAIVQLIAKIQERLPQLGIVRVDERFTSKLASQAMVASGTKKSKRQQKGSVDRVAAAIILQSYLDAQRPF